MSGEGVTYTVKELLSKLEDALTKGFESIDIRLAQIDTKLDQKADISRVAQLEQLIVRIEQRIEERLKPLEDAATGRAAVSKLQGRVGNALVAIAVAAVGALIYFALNGGAH